ncbi:hypothetical protein B9Q02_03095 [Candidatus Marsarchaeota G1 archaeon BE_D]|jgi:Small-conductance mechanosensitive channel|uniref:Mechanosensitive ion channel MscS domain-containing protein n=1 Tax=Candidatus Marsarchaeota G1 archaeon BE_D TaxID=1978156 RepID=A0A2R6AII5_9ARCH|nr:MAG: hypothetical protein B9Q02_03095 [Candidatus Marsarchaeota G1 archaeon BE_D]
MSIKGYLRHFITPILIAVVLSLVYISIFVLKVVPLKYTEAVYVVITLLLGYYLVSAFSNVVGKAVNKLYGPKKASVAKTTLKYIGYIVLAFAVLRILGVSGVALLAGGTFGGLVIGLAGQQVFSNVLAGLLLLLSRPFEVGDRITVTTWQYGAILPSYPPKYFSDDLLYPGFTGVIKDISLNYTLIKTDQGPLVKIPNNILIQAAFIVHGVDKRWVKTRYEVSKPIDIDHLLDVVREVVRKNEWVVDPEGARITIQNVTPTSIVLAIDALCKGELEDPPRSSLLYELERAISGTKHQVTTMH